MEVSETLEEGMANKIVENVSGSSQLCGFSEEFAATVSSLVVNVEENGQIMLENCGEFDVCNTGLVKADGVTEGESVVAAEIAVVGVEGNLSCVKDGVGGFVEDKMGSVEGELNVELASLTGAIMSEDVAIDTVMRDEEMKEAADSVKKVDISGDNLSLYVDFSDTLNSNADIKNRLALDRNRVRSKKLSDSEQEQLKRMFHVGDVVWVRTKNRSWWPGKIYDPLDASKYDLKVDHGNRLLVGYLGYTHTALYFPSQLKCFHENFDEIVRQNKSRSFLVAIEKAVDAFGKCLEAEITSRANYAQMLTDDAEVQNGILMKDSRYGELSLSRFEPVTFLAQLKNLGQVVMKPGMLELTALRSRLSTFMNFLGHSQLHMNQLCDMHEARRDDWRPTKRVKGGKLRRKKKVDNITAREKKFTNAMASCSRKMKKHSETEEEGLNALPDEETADVLSSSMTMGKSSELRERKRSKYLSYPYINWENKEVDVNVSGGVNTASKATNQSTGSNSVSKSSGARFQKKWLKKLIGKEHLANNPDLVNASARDLLCELCFAAVNCVYPKDTGSFDPVEWFFAKFRISAYHDEAIYEMECKNAINSSADGLVEKDGEGISQIASNTSSAVVIRKNKSKSSAGSKIKSPSSLADATLGISTDDKLEKPLTERSPTISTSKRVRKKKQKKQEATPVGTCTNQMTGLPDLNSNGVVPNMVTEKTQAISVENFEQGKKDGVFSDINRNTSGTVSVDLRVFGPSINAVHSAKDLQTVRNASGDNKPVRRRRKRKELALGQSNDASNIPDLNGSTAEPSPLTKSGKKKRKTGEGSLGKPRKSSNAATSGARMKKGGGSPATALVLTFSPGASMPSKEVLVATFSEYGALVQSQTQLMEDSRAAQVVFSRSIDAAEAVKSLDNTNPFGETLLNYKLQLLPGSPSPQLRTQFSVPVKPVASPQVETPNIDFIRQNLELMTSMLEKSGNNLSTEMRSKLETEIKGLLNKVSNVPSSQSS